MVKLTEFDGIKDYFNIPDDALAFLKAANADTECKRYDFGDSCYINIQEVETKKETPLMEAHELYADIQCLILGEERIFYTEKTALPIQRPYSEKSDAALYGFCEGSYDVTYKTGEAVILYPEEAHLPNRAPSEPMKIKKAVLKLKMSLAK